MCVLAALQILGDYDKTHKHFEHHRPLQKSEGLPGVSTTKDVAACWSARSC